MECTGLCILNGLRYDISCALKLIQAVPIMQAIQKSFVTYKAIKTRPVPAGEIQYENVAKRVVSPAFAISPTPASPPPAEVSVPRTATLERSSSVSQKPTAGADIVASGF